MQGLLVVGELADEPDDGGDVRGADRADAQESTSLSRAGTSRPSGANTGTRTGASR
ncbi:hypothetical protein BD833_102475 [Blastococcus xanthinilyticus]|uniref:Uncharacterized protein n=1 Tax=Blastococcus xanthinilyticus TaxID=1564164 RepID=A0A5S5D4B1_9ACTN|nr:hypothetical protein BD833_102475 [Blastococcus xanthinilyticus]